MSSNALTIAVQIGGQTLRLTPDEAMELWAELDAVFGRLLPTEPEPAPPQIVPVYVPWQPWISWPNQPWIGPWVQTASTATLITPSAVRP